MIQILTIPDWHPATVNQLNARNWAHGYNLKKRDRMHVRVYGLQQKIVPATAMRRVELTIHLTKGQRGCDPDAYWKSLLDALVQNKYLVNDSAKWVELAPVKYVRDGTDKRSIITLTDM